MNGRRKARNVTKFANINHFKNEKYDAIPRS